MAKKIVRGITDIKTINNQDFDTNNVNDLLSDGKHNYIHRKKQDGSEEYHNLTNNLKTIQSDDTDLVSVTNYNNTTNSATIRPKHDSQKEQVLESTDETILISHGENGTDETTTVDVNPEKVMLNNNLQTGFGIEKTFDNDTTTLNLQPTKKDSSFDVNTFFKGKVVGNGLTHAPASGWFVYENDYMDINGRAYILQTASKYMLNYELPNVKYIRTCDSGNWSSWVKQLTDESLLAQKQNTLTSNTSIGVVGTGLRQLYTQKETYTHTNGVLKTHVKSVANSSSVSTVEEEFNFLSKINEGQTTAVFTLNQHDTAVFQYLINTYGINNEINVCNTSLALNGSQLTFGTNGTTYNPHIITFSDIIPTSAINSTQSAPSRGDSVTDDKVDEIVDETVETDKVDEIVDKTE